MIVDYAPEVDTEIQYFLDEFTANGWKREDLAYITKDVGLEHKLGLVLHPKLLTYGEKDSKSQWANKIWIACKTTISGIEDKYPIDNKAHVVAEIIKNECATANISLFKDEDAFSGYFSKEFEKHHGLTIRCYFNKDYPTGFWSNHAL